MDSSWDQTYLGNIAYRQVMEATSEYESFIVETAMYQWIDCTQQIDWLIHQCMKCWTVTKDLGMQSLNGWNSSFNVGLKISKCLAMFIFLKQNLSSGQNSHKNGIYIEVLSSSSALVFCRKRYKNRRTENFRIFFFFNLSRKRNPILRIIRNQNPIISQYFASTTR
jgi:hypothetical protein